MLFRLIAEGADQEGAALGLDLSFGHGGLPEIAEKAADGDDDDADDADEQGGGDFVVVVGEVAEVLIPAVEYG